MPKTVIILGGGVAGMSAAHELIERGFAVQVYELKTLPGGKARSIPVPHTEGRRDLPGEHGFRFFPRFYKHIIDTMQRIPCGTGTVHDHLVDTTRLALARFGLPPIATLTRFPRTFADLQLAMHELFDTD